MNNYRMKKTLSLLLSMVMVLSMALCATGCSNKKTNELGNQVATIAEGQTYGEGATEFTFTVADAEGNEVSAKIYTDKTTVGEALQELNLIAGEVGQYGLFVKTVNGITLDYEKDGKYWAFYINGEYAAFSVDQTEITAGATYALKVAS